jgi:ribonuclease HII
MGYSVPEHFAALSRLGPTIHHRRSFAPVTALLGEIVVGEAVAQAVAADLPLSLPTT